MEIESKSRNDMSREVWRKEMRKSFCKKDMIDEEGNLIKEYYDFELNYVLDIFI